MKKTNILKMFFLVLFLAAMLFVPLISTTAADTVIGGSPDTVVDAGSCSAITGIGGLITCYINTVLRLLMWLAGVGSVIMIIISGFLFMTSAGDAKKAGTAKSALTAAIVGMIITLLAYSITSFVGSSLSGSWKVSTTPEDESESQGKDLYNQIFEDLNEENMQACIRACDMTPSYTGGTIKKECDNNERSVMLNQLKSNKCCCEVDANFNVTP